MRRVLIGLMMLGATVGPPARAAEPGTPPVPSAVRMFEGCWRGQGEVMGKRTLVTLRARQIVEQAMDLFEVESVTADDPADRYAAHLLFGGVVGAEGSSGERIWGFWADSFGGAYTASGQGAAHTDGFDIDYRYPDDVFVNRWRLTGGVLRWTVVSRAGQGPEKPFASYVMRRATCRRSGA